MTAETLDPVLPKRVQEKAQGVLDAAHEKELKLATAESCTGGLLAALLTDIRGRGHVFDRGFVVYSKQAKCDLFGIAREKVDNCGAVSEPIAREMALGALRRSQADISVSITGFFSCVDEGFTGAKRTLCHQVCEINYPPTTLNGLIKLWVAIYHSTPPCVD